MLKITCFGEVLWDVFPNHKKIGGAPLNVACRLRSFNNDVSMISAVGNDTSGNRILDFLQGQGVNTDCIQIQKEYKTGKVKVMLNDKGAASYDINYPRAWDKIQLTKENVEIVEKSDAFVFGSLVARDDSSKQTLYDLIERANYKVFDLNLRAPYYKKEVLFHLMERADFIKFNDDELYEVSKYLGSKYYSLEQNLIYVSKKTNTKHICVTKGEHGAVLLYNEKLYYNSGYSIKVIDTVGSGDSFLGALISQLLNKIPPQKAINFACAIGALVAQSEGANPDITDEELNAFMNPLPQEVL
ncbi:carbohydrate kinase family protein [Aestuariibaculum sediminum]|uniref:Carbohydrate kinase n=1 Tax=Aestuariibaculum sediminum TaxID=2770637 RepID=A0A8J6PZU6_9FLAO|nr:carbohydrate kinase [Aestuariibaculum sediminum]MBD0832583.1 carbohydrate kinase [Aestuariibaculum sediminum]